MRRIHRPAFHRRWGLMLLAVFASGCGDPNSESAIDQQSQREPSVSTSSESTAGLLSQRQMQQWSDSCALCHVTGVAGAPVTGDGEEWQSRLEQGRDVLLAHTLEGINSMPPLGYCMSCEADDFVAMIDFMAGGSP